METAFFSKYLLPVVIGLIMFNLGLSLKADDFKRVVKQPRAFIIGLCCQMLLLPLIAFLLAFFSNLPEAIKVGIVIIAACPGGATSNLIAYLLKGDVALSISLTAINSIFILFSIPAITWFVLQVFSDQETIISLPFFRTVIKILLMILLPTALGLAIRSRYPHFAKKTERNLKYITTGLLVIVFSFAIFENNQKTTNSLSLYISVAPYALALNFLGMLSGAVAGRLAGINTNRIITLVIEVGIQNSALAVTIASSQVFLGSPKMAIPAVVYGMFTFFNAFVFGLILKKWLAK
jgi:BASS family bile acid:Na+ symporter